ncbi:MAG: hypothetical protein QOI55_82 [Actinomycetota bacterium]|nr:hypothetical protein [Actinomycetota bacterium]
MATQHAGRHVPEVRAERIEHRGAPARLHAARLLPRQRDHTTRRPRSGPDRAVRELWPLVPGATRPGRTRARDAHRPQRAWFRRHARLRRGDQHAQRRDGVGPRRIRRRAARGRRAHERRAATDRCRLAHLPSRQPGDLRRPGCCRDRRRPVGARECGAPARGRCERARAHPGTARRLGREYPAGADRAVRKSAEAAVAPRPRMVARRDASRRRAVPPPPGADADGARSLDPRPVRILVAPRPRHGPGRRAHRAACERSDPRRRQGRARAHRHRRASRNPHRRPRAGRDRLSGRRRFDRAARRRLA